MVICLDRGADLHTAQLMPLPLTVSCSSKIQTGFTFLVPAHPGSPGQGAVKRVCVCVCPGARKWREAAVGCVTPLPACLCVDRVLGTGSQQEAGAHCGRDSCARFPARDRQAVDRGAAHRRAASRTEISSSPRLDGHDGVAAAWTRSAGLRIGAITTPWDPCVGRVRPVLENL